MPSVRVRHHTVTLGDPYGEGHELTSAEAQALNLLRADNIRLRLEREFDKRSPQRGPLIGRELELFLEFARDLDQEYAFRLRPTRRQASYSMGAFDLMCQEVAREAVQRQLNASGREMLPEQWAEAIEQMKGVAQVQELARQRLESTSESARQMLEGMLGLNRDGNGDER